MIKGSGAMKCANFRHQNWFYTKVEILRAHDLFYSSLWDYANLVTFLLFRLAIAYILQLLLSSRDKRPAISLQLVAPKLPLQAARCCSAVQRYKTLDVPNSQSLFVQRINETLSLACYWTSYWDRSQRFSVVGQACIQNFATFGCYCSSSVRCNIGTVHYRTGELLETVQATIVWFSTVEDRLPWTRFLMIAAHE